MRRKPVRRSDRVVRPDERLLLAGVDVARDVQRGRGGDDDQRRRRDRREHRPRGRGEPPPAVCGEFRPPGAVRVDDHRRHRADEQGDVADRLQRENNRDEGQQEVVERRPPQCEAGDRDQDHRLERPQIALVEVR